HACMFSELCIRLYITMFVVDYLLCLLLFCSFFFFNDTATTEIYTLSLHDALPILVDKSLNVVIPVLIKTSAILGPIPSIFVKSSFSLPEVAASSTETVSSSSFTKAVSSSFLATVLFFLPPPRRLVDFFSVLALSAALSSSL